MASIDYHIEHIRRQKGWATVQLEHRAWTNDQWGLNPVLEIGAPFLLVSFHVFLIGTAYPTGDFKFSSTGSRSINYNRQNTKLHSNQLDSWMRSEIITEHESKLEMSTTIGGVSYVGHVEIIIIREG